MENVKKTNNLKRSLSYVLTLVMLLSCWVFTPLAEKAEAATAGTYTVKVVINVTGTNNIESSYAGYDGTQGDSAGITIRHRSNNGTGTVYSKDIDIGKNGKNWMNSSGEHIIEESGLGFPEEIYGYLCDNYWFSSIGYSFTGLYVKKDGASDYVTLWTGTAHLQSKTNGYYFKIRSSGSSEVFKDDGKDKDKNNYIGSTGNNGNQSTTSWTSKFPYANSVAVSASPTALIANATGSTTNVTATVTGTVKDQYGVNWYQSPTSWKTTNNNGNTSINSTGSADSVTMSVKPTSANVSEKKETVTANFNSISGSTTVTVTPTYKITLNPNGGNFSGSTADRVETPTNGTTNATFGYNPTATPSRTGYEFLGWNTSSTATTGNKTNVSVGYNTTLYAIWKPITYTVAYNGNGSTTGSTASSSHTYDAAKALTQNGFGIAYTVTYNAGDGICDTASATATATFNGWATSASGAKVYNNNQSVTNLSSTQGATVSLYANWTPGSVTLPSASKAYDATNHYLFDGWYTAASDGTKIGASGASYTPSAATTLYAHYSTIAHTWGYTYNGNKTHNRKCTVDGYNENVACTFDSGTVKQNSTCTAMGVTTYKCTICGGSYDETDIPMKQHTPVKTAAKAPACTSAGNNEYYTCSVCHNVFKDNDCTQPTTVEEETLSSLGHNFTGAYKYNEAAKTHTRQCVNSGCDLYGDETACEFTSEITTQPTCIEKGVRTYTCSDCGGQYTEDVAPLGHNYQPYNWTWNGYESASVSLVCANDSNHTQTETAAITSEITTEPLCETTGLKVYTATVSFNGQTFTNTKEEVLLALGHVVVTDPAVEPTENSVGFTQGSHCSRCDNAIDKQEVLPMKKGGHSESADANAVKTEYAPAEGCTYVGVTTNVSDDSQILEADPKKSTTVKGNFGTFTISPDGEKADFKINSMQFTEVETFYLVTKVQIPHTDEFVYAYEKITVVPDSVIYYEDSFETETDSETGAQKKNGIVYTDGTGAGYGVWEVCGSSEASEAVDFGGTYENCASFSNGTAHSVTVSDANNPLNGGTWPKATFTFAGTGFDIVSLTDSGSGIFAVTVMQGEDIVRKCVVDTYYGYTYGNLYYRTHTKEIVTDTDVRFATYGDAVALYPTGIVPKDKDERDKYKDDPDYVISSGNGKVYTTSPSLSNNGGVQATGWYRDKFAANSEVIYQVPVIHITDLAYGTYTVTVEARFYSSFGHFGVDGEGNKFYNLCIDAVRVYNPAQNSEVAKEAYAAKGEANVGYTLIKDAIVGTDRVDGFDSVSGALFLDGSSTIDSTNLAEYLRVSPNNELYLSDGQSITFDLSTLAYNKVQIGMKAVNGKTVSVTVSYNGKTADFQIKTATEIYYSLTELLRVETISGTVVITNSGNGSAILGLTSLRTAYTEKTQSNSSPMMLSAKTAPVAEALVLANAPAREQSKTAETAPALQKLLERIAMIFRSIIEMYFSK